MHLDWITTHWDRLGQCFASFAAGHTTASVALKRQLACGPRNHFYRAVRELVGVYKTLFMLDYLTDPVLRHWDPTEAGVDPPLLTHISPIGWDNVVLYGEYWLDRGLVRHPRGRM